MTNGKTFLENTIIFDKSLSLEAIGLYAILKHYSTISNFQIQRDHIKSVSGYGETAFRRVWKELKDSSILVENKTRIKGKFEYKFTLSTSDKTTKESNKPKKSSPKKKDEKSENVEVLEGQYSIDDMLIGSTETPSQASEGKEVTLEDSIIEATGCTPEVAQASVEYAKGKGVKNIKAYAIASIKGGFTGSPASIKTEINPLKFNNFEPREYDYDDLEKKLIGWDKEEVEEIQESTSYDFLKKYDIGSAVTI